jgi:hypothetical protein
MKQCPKCGVKNKDDAKSCSRCRATLRSSTRVKDGAPEQEPPGATGMLVDPGFWASKIGRRQPRVDGRSSAERHFLVPPLGEPLALDPGRKTALLIGRDRGCDLRISSPTVSRHHAELIFKGDPPRAFIKDLGAVNATRVNGEGLKGERQLADNDVLRVGDVTAIYRLLAPGAGDVPLSERSSSEERLDATIPLGDEGEKAIEGLGGDIEFFPLGAVLGRLTVHRATGTFVVEVDGVSGHATLKDGTLVDARFAGREGADAVRAISDLRRGRFRFRPAKP